MTTNNKLRRKRIRQSGQRRGKAPVLNFQRLEPRQMLSGNCPATVVDVVRDGGDTARPDQWQTLSIRFSSGVNIVRNDLRLFDDSAGGGSVSLSGTGFSYDPATFVAEWDFSTRSEALDAAFYSYTLSARDINDATTGAQLDGNGDGTAGDSFGGRQHVALPGDANLDGDVDVSDFDVMTQTNTGDASILLGFLGTETDATWQQGDFNNDGDVDVSQFDPSTQSNLGDASILLANLGRSVKPPGDLQTSAVSLPDRETYDALAHRDNFPGALNVQEVKVLITDVNSDHPRLLFMNTNNHEFHFSFWRDVLGYTESLSSFNAQTYFTNVGRVNMAGSLVAHDSYVNQDGQQGLFTLEFWPTDPVAFEFVQKAYQLVSDAAPWIVPQLAFHAASETQRDAVALEQALYDASDIRIINTDDLFGSVVYQPMNQQESYGRLLLADSSTPLSARDIPIFQTLPNDLTTVAGIITEVPQTPLSHVNLKARQNDTPNAFIKDASTDPRITPFLDQLVFYRVGPEGFEIRTATQAEVDQYFESIRPTDPQFPARDLSVTDILPLDQIEFEDSTAFGSKAANVAELQSIMPNVAPDGFAIPYYFYDEYMTYNGFYAEASTMMADATFQSDPAIRDASLDAFRTRIEDVGTMPAWMTDALSALQAAFPSSVTPRLRSSANAEDLDGFIGAGLYDSFTHKADEGHISKSVKQVWASLWNYRAFEEREFFRVDHLQSAMGVLVHPNYSDELANGVAVTKNIFDPNWEGYYINVQVGEDLVTNPDAESIPEEMLVAALLGDQQYETQYIRSSNQLPLGQRVLTQTEILELVGQMQLINQHFASLYNTFPSDPNFIMEIEFKITAAGDLAIKQARPWVG